MEKLEKQKIHQERIAYQNELREEGEDKYFLFNTNYKHYGNSSMYLWLGSKNFESEYVVYEGDKIYDAAKENLESRIEESGFDTFREWVWENHIDERYTRDYLYEDYSEYVRESPEDWNITKEFTKQQKQYLEIHQANIDRLNQKLEDGGLTDEEQEEIESDIYDHEQLIEDIKENPEGDYDEQEIEDTIEGMVDDNVDNIFSLLRDRGYDGHALLDFVDVDAAIDYVIRTDGYGDTLNSYDGMEDSYTINGEEYYVMRYN